MDPPCRFPKCGAGPGNIKGAGVRSIMYEEKTVRPYCTECQGISFDHFRGGCPVCYGTEHADYQNVPPTTIVKQSLCFECCNLPSLGMEKDPAVAERKKARSADKSGFPLSGWCLARGPNGELSFLETQGLHQGSIENVPQGTRLRLAGFNATSRNDPESRFNVFLPNPEDKEPLSVEYLARWAIGDMGGYQVYGTEKEFYAASIDAQLSQKGPLLTGWTLARNSSNDLVFLRTKGYHTRYLTKYAPGRFLSAGFVKSRDSDSRFMVFLRSPETKMPCPRDKIVEWAKRWNGYEVLGAEKQYYMELIDAQAA